MKIEQLIQKGEKNLESEVLLTHILKKSREFLIANPEHELNSQEVSSYNDLMNRHERGEPVAYLTNLKEFYELPFYVDERVLIPRPETEFLVEKVINLCKNDPSIKKIIDIGTGSGNIAVSLAKHLPQNEITATDISEEALEVAKMNAKQMEVDINFIQSNLLNDVKEEFDVIVANLPYIGKEKNKFVAKETEQYEPHVALFGGVDGLALYEELFKQNPKFKYLLGEVGFMHHEALESLFKIYFPNSKCEIVKDLAGLDRYFIITY